MNSTPPETAAPATEPTGQPARQRVTHYDRLVDDLAYHYKGTFARDSIAQAVADARAALEPTATIPDCARSLRRLQARPQDQSDGCACPAERGITLTGVSEAAH